MDTYTRDGCLTQYSKRVSKSVAFTVLLFTACSAFAFSTVPPTVQVDWSSGKTNHLSEWKKVTCAATYGSVYVLTGLEAFREPKSNLDNFIAKLRAECTRYATLNGVVGQTSAKEEALVYSEKHRDPGAWTRISNSHDLPVGVAYKHNTGEGYIKDVAIRIGDPATTPSNTNDVSWFDTSAIAGWTNDTSHGTITNYLPRLDCPRLHVLAGIGVRHDTRNGKIRDLRIFCRQAE